MLKGRFFQGLVFLIFAALFFACSSSPKELLTRKWKPVDAKGPGISEIIRKNILEEGNMLEFSKSGKFTSYTTLEGPQHSRYNLNEDGNSIIIRGGTEMQTEMRIIALTRKKLVVETNGLELTLEPVD